MQCERDDPVGMEPWSSEQEIVRRVSVDDKHVTSDFKSPIGDESYPKDDYSPL